VNQSSDPQGQRAGNTAEYVKFAALLVMALIAILALAVLSPRLIGQGVPSVLGLDGAPAAEGAPLVEPSDAVAPESSIVPQDAAAPEQAAPETGQGGLGVKVEGLRHEVQVGETLFQLAELYGVSVQEIAAANHLVNPLQVQAGMVLIIPQPR